MFVVGKTRKHEPIGVDNPLQFAVLQPLECSLQGRQFTFNDELFAVIRTRLKHKHPNAHQRRDDSPPKTGPRVEAACKITHLLIHQDQRSGSCCRWFYLITSPSQRIVRTLGVVSVEDDIRAFLSSMVGQDHPEEAGLTAYGRNRRVPGLRRVEVAMLAGISVEYYTSSNAATPWRLRRRARRHR